MSAWSQVLKREVPPKVVPLLERALGAAENVRFVCRPRGMHLHGDPGQDHTLLTCALTDERLVGVYEHGLLRLKYYAKVLELADVAGRATLGSFEFGGRDVFTVAIPHRSRDETLLWFDAEPAARLVAAQLSGDPALAELERSMDAIERARSIAPESLEAASADDLSALAGWMGERYRADDLRAVWERRVAIAHGLPRDRMRQPDYFWTNAWGALAGLSLHESDHPGVALSAGLAEQAMDPSDPAQVEAVERINRLYHD